MTKAIFINDEEYILKSGKDSFEIIKSGKNIYRSKVEPNIYEVLDIVNGKCIDKTA